MKLFLAVAFNETVELIPSFLGVEGDELTGWRVTFITTASKVEPNVEYLQLDRQAWEDLGVEVDELDVSTATSEEIEQKLRINELIFVAGGNTFYLLQELWRSGAADLIKEQVTAGKPYLGSSAGSVIAAPDIEYVRLMDDPALANTLHTYQALALIPLYPLPHYKSPPFTRVSRITYREYVDKIELVTLTNQQVLVVQDEITEVWQAES